jgi:uncharacterized membrane protein
MDNIASRPRSRRVALALRLVLAVSMVAVGVLHFTSPEGFVRIVPAYLPAPLALVYVSGAFEIAGGLGLLVARLRRAAAYGLIALYVAVFPANVNMAVHQIPLQCGRSGYVCPCRQSSSPGPIASAARGEVIRLRHPSSTP